MKIQEEKEGEKLLKQSLAGLFSGKYDLLVKPSEDGDHINISLVIRVLVNTVQELVKRIEELEELKRKKVCV